MSKLEQRVAELEEENLKLMNTMIEMQKSAVELEAAAEVYTLFDEASQMCEDAGRKQLPAMFLEVILSSAMPLSHIFYSYLSSVLSNALTDDTRGWRWEEDVMQLYSTADKMRSGLAAWH